MAKRDTRVLFIEGKEWTVIANLPTDYDKEEVGIALSDGVIKIVAVKSLTGPMDERVWMDLTPSRLSSEDNYRFNNLFKMPNIWHVTSTDGYILTLIEEQKKKLFPQSVSTIHVSGEVHDVIEVDGKYYIQASKICQVCGLEIQGTRQVYKKGDIFTYPQMFVADPKFEGAKPAKFKSKMWVCKEHAPVDVTKATEGQYGTISVPKEKKTNGAVVTPGELKDAQDHIKELRQYIMELKFSTLKLWTVEELIQKLWDMVDDTPATEIGGIVKFIHQLKKK